MNSFIIASNNNGKIREISYILKAYGFDAIGQKEAGYDLDVEETGNTFEENAFLKASALTSLSGKPAVADDSGLVVDALNGEPGIYSARYGPGQKATDRERYEYLLKRMQGVTNRSARFVCSICCTFPDKRFFTVRGECEGEILLAPRGENGFGYDPVFRALASSKSNAELTAEEKLMISHRGIALRLFKNKLENYIDDYK